MDSRILHYEFVTGESVNITVYAPLAGSRGRICETLTY